MIYNFIVQVQNRYASTKKKTAGPDATSKILFAEISKNEPEEYRQAMFSLVKFLRKHLERWIEFEIDGFSWKKTLRNRTHDNFLS